jgi:hypothetical protein
VAPARGTSIPYGAKSAPRVTLRLRGGRMITGLRSRLDLSLDDFSGRADNRVVITAQRKNAVTV